MGQEDFSLTVSVDRTPEEVFAAITNTRGWWSEDIDGGTAELGDEFTYRYFDDHRCTIRLTEVVPGERIVWRVLENYFSFTEDKSEWTGTDLVFDIAGKDGGAELHFTHLGLVPEYECFNVCSKSWSFYIGISLRDLITTGRGRPNTKTAGGEIYRAPLVVAAPGTNQAVSRRS